jgi:hypothetical protein
LTPPSTVDYNKIILTKGEDYMSLYQLTNEFVEIMSQLEEMEIDQETLVDTLDSLQAPIAEKAENLIKYMKNIEALAEAKKAEAKRLHEAAQADLMKVERLKEYLDQNLQRAGITKLQAGLFELKYRKGTEVVMVKESLDINTVPREYLKYKDPELNKVEIKKLLKTGIEIPGITLVRKPDSLVIK